MAGLINWIGVYREVSKLYTYILREDSGFAPNPFHGFCTLATCKPGIRNKANIDDWIVGFSSKTKYRDRRLVYAMRVLDVLDFDEYWTDDRFECKKPKPNGSRNRQCGDNMYHRHPDDGSWIQEPGWHNEHDKEYDTRYPNAIISNHFVYYGNKAVKIPQEFRDWNGIDVCPYGRGHRCNFPDDLRDEFIRWLDLQIDNGVHGEPLEWPCHGCSPNSRTPSKPSEPPKLPEPPKPSSPGRSC